MVAFVLGTPVNGASTSNGNGTHETNGPVDKAPARPLNITIVGAGLGGLTAAIYLRRAGHNITVRTNNTIFTALLGF